MDFITDLLLPGNDSIAATLVLYSFVIAAGIFIGKLKICGVSLGVTFVLFVGILMGHFGYIVDEHILKFVREFGLILFVYSIGLQVGPGFFSAFKKGGATLNLIAAGSVALSVAVAVVLHYATGIPARTMTGILSGAVTNTPGLGAAQQAASDLFGTDAPEIAMGYAVAYPLGVVGAIAALLALKGLLHIVPAKEEEEAAKGLLSLIHI